MNQLSSASCTVCLRPANETDKHLLFDWRNRPEIVALGSSLRSVNADEHEEWFALTLDSEVRRLFIIMINNSPSGQVRFDLGADGEAEISIFLLPDFTGKGLGVRAICEGCTLAFWTLPVRCIVAFVRETNGFSLSAFHKAGFEHDPTGVQRPGHSRFRLFRQ